jgi:hypothetical protein
MATKQEIDALYNIMAEFQRRVISAIAPEAAADPAIASLAAARISQLEAGFETASLAQTPPPPDGGDAGRIGLGEEAAPTLGQTFFPLKVEPYDDTVPSGRLRAAANLYYCYQHERLGMFRAIQKLQELFRAGTLRLEGGPGAFGLYRFDMKSTLRYTREQRMQAYRRVFGYTNAAPPAGARSNDAFHALLQGFATELANLFRDKRIALTIRGPATTPDASFGSVASARRAGLDFRANLKQAAYGDVNVLTVELLQLLRQAFDILGSDDILRQFGADNAWDALEEVLSRYLGENPVASQRSRMGETGRKMIEWLAQPYILATDRTTFEANAQTVAEYAEEWLTSAQSVGLLSSTPGRHAGNVVPLRRASAAR